MSEPGTSRSPLSDAPVETQRYRWEWLWWLAIGLLLAVFLTWPLVRHLSTSVPQDLGDPLAEAWFLAWGGHALLDDPGRLFDGNTFWPARTSYAFSDTMLGYAPAAFFGEGQVSAIVRYNLMFLFSYTLAFVGATLLARDLRCGPVAAVVAGVAFAWAPWKISHNGQLNIISTGGIPLALALLISGYRRGRPWQVVAGWSVAAWQMSLGFSLGIYFAYLLAVLALLAAVHWLRMGRPVAPRLFEATAVGSGIFLAVCAFMATPYLAIAQRDPSATRGREEIEFFSPPLQGLLAAHDHSRAWGATTRVIRETLPWVPEQTLFPGLTVVVLAVIGLRWRGAPRGLRVGLMVGIVVTLLLSFGLRLWGGLLYAPLAEHAPGWDAVRTPGRLALLWSLGLALLAGMGAQHVMGGLRAVVRRHFRSATRHATAASGSAILVLAGLVAFEGAPRLPVHAVPLAPPVLQTLPAPRLHLPSDPINDMTYMLWSTEGFPNIGNGNASYTPPSLTLLRAHTMRFPDRESVRLLQRHGFRTVVVHRDRLPGTPWAAAADMPVAGLGIRRDEVGELVIFYLEG